MDHQLVGNDRYETGTKVASTFFSNPDMVTFASGQNFPDALSGGAGVVIDTVQSSLEKTLNGF